MVQTLFRRRNRYCSLVCTYGQSERESMRACVCVCMYIYLYIYICIKCLCGTTKIVWMCYQTQTSLCILSIHTYHLQYTLGASPVKCRTNTCLQWIRSHISNTLPPIIARNQHTTNSERTCITLQFLYTFFFSSFCKFLFYEISRFFSCLYIFPSLFVLFSEI